MKQPITRKWTEDDVTRLLQLIDEGATLMRDAAALNRGTSSAQKKARSLGKSFDGVRKVRANLQKAGVLEPRPYPYLERDTISGHFSRPIGP